MIVPNDPERYCVGPDVFGNQAPLKCKDCPYVYGAGECTGFVKACNRRIVSARYQGDIDET